MALWLPYALQALTLAEYEKTVDFREKWKMKVRELMTEQEWKRRKMQMRVRKNRSSIGGFFYGYGGLEISWMSDWVLED